MKVRLCLPLLVVAVGFVGSPPASAQSSDAKRIAYLKSADSICEASNTKLLEAARSFEKHDMLYRRRASTQRVKVAKPVDVEAFIKTSVLATVKDEVAQLALLVPAESDRAIVNGFLDTARKQLKTLESNPREAAFTSPFMKLGKSMKAYGYTSCFQSLPVTTS